MTRIDQNNPFKAPGALIDPEPITSTRPGWFWGVVFSLPVVAFQVLIALATPQYARSGDVAEVWNGVFLILWMGLFAGLILGCGWSWARYFNKQSGMLLVGIALVWGFGGELMFLAGGWFFMSHDSTWSGFPIRNIDDAMAAILGWIAASLYALLQGLLVRWSLRRWARKQA